MVINALKDFINNTAKCVQSLKCENICVVSIYRDCKNILKWKFETKF